MNGLLSGSLSMNKTKFTYKGASIGLSSIGEENQSVNHSAYGGRQWSNRSYLDIHISGVHSVSYSL